MAFGEVIARLSVQLGLDTAAFSTGSAKARKEVTGLQRHIARAGTAIKVAGAAILGGAIFGEVARLAQEGLEYASSLGEVAQQLGVTSKALQEYRYAASQAGIEQEEMDKGLSKLSIKIGQAAEGNKKAADLFARLGIAVRDSSGNVRDAGDVLPDVAEAYRNLGSAAERSALSAEVFGAKMGPKFNALLAEGRDGVNGLRDAAQKLGIVLSEDQIAKADETADKLSALKQVLEARIAAAVSDNADSILELVNALIKLVEYAGKAVKAWRYFTTWVKTGKSYSQQALDELGAGVELTDSAAAAIQARRDAAFLRPSGGSLTRTPPKSSAPVQSNNPFLRASPSLLQRRNAVGGPLSSFTPGLGSADWIRSAEATGALATNLSRVAETLPKISINAGAMLARAFAGGAEEMERLAAATQSIVDRLYPQEARRRQYELDLATLQAGYRAAGKSAEELADAQAKLTREFNLGYPAVDAMVRGFARFKDAAAQASDAAARVDLTPLQQVQVNGLQSLQEGLVSAAIEFDNLGQTAKRVVQSILADLLRLAIQKAIIKPLAGALGLPIPGFASGTNWAPRGLALVGERGPELVQFRGGEKVIPNDQIAGRVGRAGDTFNISVSGAMSDRDARRTGHQIAASVSQRQAQARKAGIAG